jgi:hypothetical protein
MKMARNGVIRARRLNQNIGKLPSGIWDAGRREKAAFFGVAYDLHMTRNMATRVNLLKLLQEIRGYADMATQRPAFGSVYMLPQPRFISQSIYRRKIRIRTSPQDNVSQPVRVTVVQTASQ